MKKQSKCPLCNSEIHYGKHIPAKIDFDEESDIAECYTGNGWWYWNQSIIIPLLTIPLVLLIVNFLC